MFKPPQTAAFEYASPAALAYLAKFDVAFIAIAAAPGADRPVLVCSALDLRRSLMAHAGIYESLRNGAEVRWAAACQADAGRRIVQRVTGKGGKAGMLGTDVAGAVRAIQGAAAAYQVGLAGYQQTLERATQLTDRIAGRLDVQRESGGLQFIAAQYRARRLAARAAGKKFPTWPMVERRMRNALAEHAAGRMTGAATTDILTAVFGDG